MKYQVSTNVAPFGMSFLLSISFGNMEWTSQQKSLLEFVKKKHGDQKRKYTGAPYWTHLVAVATIVKPYAPEGVEIALCHDLFEDTSCGEEELLSLLTEAGYTNEKANMILHGALELTDQFVPENYPELNRKERKKREAVRLGEISALAQTVKYADLIDNSSSIIKEDPGFARIYLSEKQDILNVMRAGNPTLLKRCEKIID
ncbi:MAG: metal-dependent phosphohydrolase [Cytophagales bacterium]|nr:metal-dependent phosphohydrolase [Cytophagales bacterium]